MVSHKDLFSDVTFSILYINDIINSSKCLCYILLADDTNIYCSGKNLKDLQTKLNEELIRVQQWMNSNQLTIFIIFRSNKKSLKVEVNICLSNLQIQRVK